MDHGTYFDNVRSNSPRDDLRNYLEPRTNMRYGDELGDSYRNRSPHRDGYNTWESNSKLSRSNPPQYSNQSSSRYVEHEQSGYSRRSPERDYRSDAKAWPSSSKESFIYDPDVHRKYLADAENYSSNPDRGRSPFRRHSPFPYSNSQATQSRSQHYSRSRSRSPIFTRRRSRSRSPRYESTIKNSSNASDLLSSIYSTGKDAHNPDDSHIYLGGKESHIGDAFDRSRKSYDYEERESRSSYSEQKKQVFSDERDRFSHGDNSDFNRYSKEKVTNRSRPSPQREARSSSSEKQAVTPGGFDTNALKNVLKAIGFDFELSAQSLQKSALADSMKISSSSGKKSQPVDSRREVKNIRTVKTTKSSAPPTVPEQSQVVFPFQPAAQSMVSNVSYISPGVDPNFIYTQGGLPFPSNFPTPQMIYQSGLPQTGVVPLVQASNASAVNERPNLKVVVPTVSMKPLEVKEIESIKSVKALEQEKRERKKRLDHLEVELKNLKRKQAEVSRIKKRQFDSMDRQQMKENSAMQAGVEKELQEIREAAERAAGIRSSSESSGSDSSSGSSSNAGDLKFIDSGSHYCSDCNVPCPSMPEYFNHLHSKSHKKLMDPSDKPWYKKLNLKSKPNAPTEPCRGIQFLLPISGFFCKLCEAYAGDGTAAGEHCKSQIHNQNYAIFCKKHPEKNHEKNKENRELQLVASKLKKLKDERKDDEVSIESKNRLPPQYVEASRTPKEKLPYDERNDDRFYDDRKLEKNDRKSDNYDRKCDNYDRKSDLYDRKSDVYDRKSDNYDRKSDLYDRKSDTYDRKPDSYERKPESYDRKSDNYDQKSDVYDRKSDVYDRKSDNYDRKSDNYDQKSDVYDRKSDHYDRKSDKHFVDRKDEKRYDERKDRDPYHSRQQYSRSDDKKRDDGSISSRSSSRAYDISPLRGKGYKSHADSKLYEKRSKFDNHRRNQKSPVQGGFRKRSQSPYRGRALTKDEFAPQKAESTSRHKERFDQHHQKYSKGNRKGSRKWSPGYDAFEESREKSESSKASEEKKPSSNFSKFTWHKKTRKISGSSDKNGDSVDTASKTSNVTNRVFRNRSNLTNRLASFAPHTQIRPSLKQKSTSKAAAASTKVKAAPKKPTPAPQQVPISNLVTATEKNIFEPPPPGTEDIFMEGEAGSDSDISGISMEIGSDNEP